MKLISSGRQSLDWDCLMKVLKSIIITYIIKVSFHPAQTKRCHLVVFILLSSHTLASLPVCWLSSLCAALLQTPSRPLWDTKWKRFGDPGLLFSQRLCPLLLTFFSSSLPSFLHPFPLLLFLPCSLLIFAPPLSCTPFLASYSLCHSCSLLLFALSARPVSIAGRGGGWGRLYASSTWFLDCSGVVGTRTPTQVDDLLPLILTLRLHVTHEPWPWNA